jgi:hypothetical protein
MSDEPRTPDDEVTGDDVSAAPTGARGAESSIGASPETGDAALDSGVRSVAEGATEGEVVDDGGAYVGVGEGPEEAGADSPSSESEDAPLDSTFVSPTPLAAPVVAPAAAAIPKPAQPPKPAKPPKPARPPASKTAAPGAVRKVELTLSRVDPLSVMKMSFLLSVAIGIVIVVATAVLWSAIDSMQIFAKIDDFIQTVMEGSSQRIDVLQYVAFNRVISLATLIAVVDVFILTALGTIFAFLYNVIAALVGGIHVTLTDD